MPKLFFRPDGSIEGIYDDIFTDIIACSADVRMERASHVEFNPVLKVWEVILPDGQIIHRNPSRKKAIEFEIAFWERKLEKEEKNNVC